MITKGVRVWSSPAPLLAGAKKMFSMRVPMRTVERRRRKACLPAMLLLSLPLFASGIGQAEQLPVRTYTTADGLPRDYVLRIVRDSHGFLWFCTGDGLSRFNGYEFTNYGVEHGLSNPRVNDLLETRSGVFWVATENGVSRFNPTALRNEQT